MSSSFYNQTNPSKFGTSISNRVKSAIQDYSGLIDDEAHVYVGVEWADYLFWNDISERWEVGRNEIKQGAFAGQFFQGTGAVAVGNFAGNEYQFNQSVAVGQNAGKVAQGTSYIFESENQTLKLKSGPKNIMVPKNRNKFEKNKNKFENKLEIVPVGEGNAIAIGNSAGENYQGEYSVAIGYYAGKINQAQTSISIGFQAGEEQQNYDCIAIGRYAGEINQGTGPSSGRSIAIGNEAGENNQGGYSIAIGNDAAEFDQGVYCVAIGSESGENQQSEHSIAIGHYAGEFNQGATGGTGPTGYSIAIGNEAGQEDQGSYSIAIGNQAGENFQGIHSVAIGTNAGQFNQGNYSIAIGYNAANNNQNENSIVINANNGVVNTSNSGLYVTPIRNTYLNGSYSLYYNTGTYELTYAVRPSSNIILNNVAPTGAYTGASSPGTSVTEWVSTYTNNGGQLRVQGNLTLRSIGTNVGMVYYLLKNSSVVYTGTFFNNVPDQHLVMPSINYIYTGVGGATDTFAISLGSNSVADSNDVATIIVTEQ